MGPQQPGPGAPQADAVTTLTLSLSLSFFLPICTISITPQQGVATLFTTENGGRVERLQSSNFGHGVADYTMDNPAASPRVVTAGNEF